MVARPRRSVLYMPGSNAKALAKARGLPADAVILDLEDSVAPDAKVAARAQVVAGGARGRLRGARGRRPRERRSYPVGRGGPGCGDFRRAGCNSAPQDRRSRRNHVGGARPQRRPRAGEDPPLGDDGNADGDLERRLDRRDGGRSDRAPRSAGDGSQRPRQGDPRAAHPRPRDVSRPGSRSASPPRAPMAATFSTASTTTSKTSTASATNANRAAKWASTARR